MSFTRFKGNSCPVCHGDRKDKDCRRSDTTGLVHCRGRHIYDFVPGYECVGEDSIGFPMWSDGTGRAGPRKTSGPSPAPAPKPAFDPAKHFSEYINADRTSRPFHTRLEADELFVTELGLPSWAVDCMTWSLYTDSFNRYCWTCREWGLVDGQVVPVGRHFRYPGGSKRTYGNPLLPDNVSKRGVFQPTEWWDESGPVYLPEGASDAVTIKVMGYPAIGRPNNGPGGVDAACHLVEQRTPGRDVWVLIENDQKPDGRWPALEGGRQAAALAAKLLGRPVLVVAPPPQHKDVRAYFKAYQAAGLSVARIADYWLDAAVVVEAFEPGEQAPPVSPARPAPASDTASDTAIPSQDYSDLEGIDWEAHREEVGAEFGAARLDLPASPNPCAGPQFVGLQHEDNWNPLEVKKRCGKCCGCRRHKVAVNLRVIRLFLGLALSAGCRLFFATLTSDQWAAWRQRYTHTTPFEGKGYFCFRSEGGFGELDTLHVLTTVPGLGAPLSPGSDAWEELVDALAQVEPWLAEAIERGGRPYSSSRGWEKDTLPQASSGFKFRARLDPIDDDYRARILEDVQAECRGIPVPESDPSALHYRLYYKPGGWDSDSLERFWSQREGYTLPGGERIEIVLGTREHAQADADQPQDGWEGEWMPDPFAGL